MERDDERTSVKTYVPQYQKEEWRRHADELEMSQAEFVRTMVQAGRRGFGSDANSNAPTDGGSDETPSRDGDDVETHVVDALAEAGVLSWDALLDALTGSIEDRLDEALQDLQSEDRVRYSGRDGGYTLNGDE